MDLVAQPMALADRAPAHLEGTAHTIRIVAITLRRRLDTPAKLAHTLRTFAAENRRTAERLRAIEAVSVRFDSMASLLETAASTLDHEHVQEVSR